MLARFAPLFAGFASRVIGDATKAGRRLLRPAQPRKTLPGFGPHIRRRWAGRGAMLSAAASSLLGVVATADPVLGTYDREAFQRLACEELAGLYALARRLAGGDAEDLVQEALLRAYRSFGSLRDRQAGTRWLRVILTNVWRDRLRRRCREPDLVPIDDVDEFSLFRTLIDEDPFPYSDTLHLDFLGAFSSADVHAVLEGLPEHYRAPLVLRYVEGFATKQIARMLGVPFGTVLSQLHRGRKVFERELWRFASSSGYLVDSRPRTAGKVSGRAT